MSEWYFSEDDCRLISPERVVQLTPKAASILACLQRNLGEIVSTKTILEDVWQETHVTPDLVREYIHDLRQALRDDARNPRFIETIRGKGFRLLCSIESTKNDLNVDSQGQLITHRPVVAVVKPETTKINELNAVAEEVASEVINRLARFHYIAVVARQSTFAVNKVSDIRSFGRHVQARYILDSNYALLGGNIRARVQLVDASTDQNLWGTRIDAAAEDPGAAIEKICDTIVMALTGWHGELHRAEFKSVIGKRSSELNAFEHFILGCDLEMRLDADNLLRSLSHLENSVRLDPTFARAWLVYALQLRWAYSVIPGRDRTYLKKSENALETSFNLAPADPVNLALLAMNTARIGNIDGALAMLRRAETTMGGDSDAMVCVATAKSVLSDDANGASAILDRVMQDNSAPPSWVHFAEAGVAFMSGQYERCVASSYTGPQELSALVFRCLALAMLGQIEEALQMKTALITHFPEFNFESFAEHFPIASVARRSEYDMAVAQISAVDGT